MPENVLEVSNVTKRFANLTAVDDVSFSIPRGAIYGFLGQNGAGKTTTIRMIVDILRPTAGRISILGASSALDVRERIGYLPEEKGLYKKMTAAATVAYFATLKGMGRRDARHRAQALLEEYGLGDFANSRIEDLSKGMSQKVQVLSAMSHDPEFVILDEPFSGLDPVNQQVLEQLIRNMATQGRTIIFSTHVMQHAERLCDQLLLIARGRKIFDGSVADAKRTIPRRVVIETRDDIRPLKELTGVLRISRPETDSGIGAADADGYSTWEIRIEERMDPQTILEKCFSAGIALRRFDHSEPSLHDVFVALVGSESPDRESA